jgi:hypothetical protein
VFNGSAKKREAELTEWHALTSYLFVGAVSEGQRSGRFQSRQPDDILLWYDAAVAAAIDVAETIGAGSVEALKSNGGAEPWRGMRPQAALRAMDARMGFIVARSLAGPHRGPAEDCTARIPLLLDDHRAVSLEDPWCATLFELHLRHYLGSVEPGTFRTVSPLLMELVDSPVAGTDVPLDALVAGARLRGAVTEWDLVGSFDGPRSFLERSAIGFERALQNEYGLMGEFKLARDLRERFGDQLWDALGDFFGTR